MVRVETAQNPPQPNDEITLQPYSSLTLPKFPSQYFPQNSMDPLNSKTPNRAEAERSLDIAAKLLSVRDLVGAKRFAELALSADPALSDERPDQILAVADVLLSTQKPNLDYYSILHISPSSSSSSTFDLDLKRQFRRLSLLLNPDRNKLPGADHAYRIIFDAYHVLSDPTRRSSHDSGSRISSTNAAWNANLGDADAFWALCPGCCHVHLYGRAYLNKVLRCQVCGKGFDAVELSARPTVVPGTDMYYATWGFFPLGFTNPSSSDWKPFVPVSPGSNAGGGVGEGGGVHQNEPMGGGPENEPGPGTGSGRGRKKKTTARKKVMSGLKNRIFGRVGSSGGGIGMEEMKESDGDVGVGEKKPQEEEEAARGININEAAKGVGEDENIEMIIDLDTTDGMLGNLHNLPFLKDDGINIQFP